MPRPNERWILCDHCDAIHRLALGHPARSMHCGHCGLEQPVPLRDERPLAHPHSPLRDTGAADYFAVLRAQDGQPAPLPPHLAPLVEAGELAETGHAEALARLRQARLDLRRAPSARTREDVYWLALLLSNHHLVYDELDRQRAVLETALDLVVLPRHRQVLRCMLGMTRAAAGDLDGAEAWIAPCDPKSGDLQADSALRILAAFIATARGHRAEVLRHLGDHHDAIPIDDAREAMAAVLRANALEKSGRRKEAVRALMDTIAYLGPFSHRHMEAFAALHPRLMLCSSSFPEVTKRRRKRAASDPVSLIFAVPAVLFGLMLLVVAAVVWEEIVRLGHLPILPADSESNSLGVAFVPPIIGFGALVFGVNGIRGWFARRRIARQGVPANARVLAIEPTGTSINDVPQVRVRLRVTRPGHAAHASTVVALLDEETAAALQGGRAVPVLIDPDKPQHAILER